MFSNFEFAQKTNVTAAQIHSLEKLNVFSVLSFSVLRPQKGCRCSNNGAERWASLYLWFELLTECWDESDRSGMIGDQTKTSHYCLNAERVAECWVDWGRGAQTPSLSVKCGTIFSCGGTCAALRRRQHLCSMAREIFGVCTEQQFLNQFQ